MMFADNYKSTTSEARIRDLEQKVCALSQGLARLGSDNSGVADEVRTVPPGLDYRWVFPVEVLASGAAVGWTTFECPAEVPRSTQFVVVEAVCATLGNAVAAELLVRQNERGAELSLLHAQEADGATNIPYSAAVQALVPISRRGGKLEFDYSVVTGFDRTLLVRIIGAWVKE